MLKQIWYWQVWKLIVAGLLFLLVGIPTFSLIPGLIVTTIWLVISPFLSYTRRDAWQMVLGASIATVALIGMTLAVINVKILAMIVCMAAFPVAGIAMNWDFNVRRFHRILARIRLCRS